MNIPTKKTDSAGFTIVEMVVAATALLLLSLMVTQLIMSGQQAHRYSTRLGKLTDVTHRVLDELKTDLRAAVRVFSDDDVGNRYRNLIDPWIGFAPIESSRLPRVSPNESFGADVTGAEKTGNELLFARHAWSDSFTCSSGRTYRADVYRIERLFLRVAGSNQNSAANFNLCKWTSEPLVRANQIDRITDPADRSEYLQHLLNGSPDDEGEEHDPLQVVWRFGEDPADPTTLRQILGDGLIVNDSQPPRADAWNLLASESLSEPGLFYSNRHTIASNTTRQTYGVSRFGRRDDNAGNGTGFPHGLEFQVVGTPASRRVLIHLTTVSTNNDGLKAQFDVQAIINIREG